MGYLEHVWVSEKIPKESEFHKLVRQLTKIKEESEWRDEMKKKRKLRTYRKIKMKLELEQYVVELDREKRRHLTMLRGGTNRLRIDVGRRKGLKEEERVCQACLCEDVEDEKHFLLSCPMYVSERIDMFNRIRTECKINEIERLDEDKQIDILIGIGWRKKETEIREIVLEYIRKAFDIRKRLVPD